MTLKPRISHPMTALLMVLATIGGACCCSVLHSSKVQGGIKMAQISLPPANLTKEVDTQEDTAYRDTLVIRNIDGRDMILMKTVIDDDGQAVASQVLKAAKVTARFRNVAERHGKVDISFQVTIPQILQHKDWQIRYTPSLYMLGDSSHLDKIIVTGREYRRKQLRGYQQYQRFLDSIISSNDYFIDRDALEIFIKRNMPRLWAMRSDSTFVSDESFNSLFDVTETEAVEHYTNHLAIRLNDWRKQRRGLMFRKYVKVPLHSDGVKIDTTIDQSTGDLILDYTHSIRTQPGLKRVDIILDGEIYQQDKLLCNIGRSERLNYYISSLSFFVDDSPRYITRVIERQVGADISYNLDFKSGSSELLPELGHNRETIEEIKSNIRALSTNETFDLDSICVVAGASPEGAWKMNLNLSRSRSRSICNYFGRFLDAYLDSLRKEAGAVISVDENMRSTIRAAAAPRSEIKFMPRFVGENWALLDSLVARDLFLDEGQKARYEALGAEFASSPDVREQKMAAHKWYSYVRGELYPRLRSVDFNFRMHRKGMVKDTIHTTVIDSVYLHGVQAIKDRDYEKAIELLRPYNDYNTAVAYCAKDYNHSALAILHKCPDSPRVNYMMALLYSRTGNPAKALEYYLRSCHQDPSLIHRGNLDPEINTLTKQYNINL